MYTQAFLHRHFPISTGLTRSQHVTTMRSAETPSKPPSPSPQTPQPAQRAAFPPNTSILQNQLTSTLYQVFQKSPESCKEKLKSLFSSNLRWSTPIFESTTSNEAITTFDSFLSFALEPTLQVYSIDINNNTFCWTLSFTYPLPWRPRVSVAGNTKYMIDEETGKIYEIIDKWIQSPITLLIQTIPRLDDFVFLFPAPHAETDRGIRKVLKKYKGYQITQISSCIQLRVLDEILDVEERYVFATPALPEYVFEGRLGKLERYFTTSPICVRRRKGGNMEWRVNVPGRLCGSSEALMLIPEAEKVDIIEEEEKIYANVRFGGLATWEVVEKKLDELIGKLKKDGLLDKEQVVEEERIWMRVYDGRVGFNRRGRVAMAMYGAVVNGWRVNELAVDITDKWKKI